LFSWEAKIEAGANLADLPPLLGLHAVEEDGGHDLHPLQLQSQPDDLTIGVRLAPHPLFKLLCTFNGIIIDYLLLLKVLNGSNLS